MPSNAPFFGHVPGSAPKSITFFYSPVPVCVMQSDRQTNDTFKSPVIRVAELLCSTRCADSRLGIIGDKREMSIQEDSSGESSCLEETNHKTPQSSH